jgi:hypothetical protein
VLAHQVDSAGGIRHNLGRGSEYFLEAAHGLLPEGFKDRIQRVAGPYLTIKQAFIRA